MHCDWQAAEPVPLPPTALTPGTNMIIDFQHHYTPPALLKGRSDAVSVGIDERGNPMHLLNPLLGDIDAHVRMMDHAGIDAAVLSSMVGFDQPDLSICRTINDDMREVEGKHPGRFIGLAHVPAFQQRDKWGTSGIAGHNRRPPKPFDHYLEQRLYYDCAGWAGPDHAGAWGAEWVRFGMNELALTQLVFATDYPQAVRT